MRGLLVFLAIIAAAAAADFYKPGVRVKFELGLNPAAGESYFFKVYMTVREAIENGWKRASAPKGPLPQLKLYCLIDRVLCAYYDDTDYVAGTQIAIAKAEFTENVFDWTKRGFTPWNTVVEGKCKQFWTIQQYFVDEEYLARNRSERLAARERNPDRVLQAGALWVTGTDRKLEKIPNSKDEIAEAKVFTEQACIPWMGIHYYYNMTKNTECTADQMFPWFPLVSYDELIGVGFLTFGKLELRDGYRDWFERPGWLAVEAIVPHGPQCLYDYSGNPGVVTMHTYFIDEPWVVGC